MTNRDNHALRRFLALPTGRRTFVRGGLTLSAAAAAAYAVGCGGSDGDDGEAPSPSPTVAGEPTASGGGIRPVLLASEFVVGQPNRFLVGLLEGQRMLSDAAVHARFFTLAADGVTGTLHSEADMEAVELNVAGAHAHDTSSGEVVSDDSVAFYVAEPNFDSAGRWGVEVAVTPAGGEVPARIQVPIEVLAESRSPGLGTVPPASRNDTAATNTDPQSICSREPVCPLHDKVIADALGQGRPLVVQFSTPAFCETRFCGPVLEVLLQEVPAYQDRVDFVHIEVWKDFQAQQYREAMVEWGLPSEPYTFFVGPDGRIVSKLEAIFSEEELREALEGLVSA